MRELESKVLRNCLGFDFRGNVFQATLRLSFYNKLMVWYCMSSHAKIFICLY